MRRVLSGAWRPEDRGEEKGRTSIAVWQSSDPWSCRVPLEGEALHGEVSGCCRRALAVVRNEVAGAILLHHPRIGRRQNGHFSGAFSVIYLK